MQVRTARHWAILCMAAWLMGTVLMAIVATQNFYTIYRLMASPAHPVFAADIEKLGHDAAFDLLYYFSSELNRLYFQYWNVAQLPMGIAALWLVVKIPASENAKRQIIAMLGIVLFLTLLITPRMLTVGRSIDFVPRDPPPDGLRTFGLLHATYSVFDGIELILGIIVTLWLTKSKD